MTLSTWLHWGGIKRLLEKCNDVRSFKPNELPNEKQTPATCVPDASPGLKPKDQRVDMPGLGSILNTYWNTKWSFKWRCTQYTSADQTPTPVASPGFKLKGTVCEEQTLRRFRTGQANLPWAAKPINAVTPGLGTTVCLLHMKHHQRKCLHLNVPLSETRLNPPRKNASTSTRKKARV